MIKNSINYGILVLAALTACTAEKMDAPAVKNTAISLTSQVQTRATADPQTTALSTSNTVGVFVTSGQATITNGNNNEHSVDATGALTTSNTMNYPSEDGTKVNIYAYAPYASGMALSSDNAFSVSTDQSADSGYLASDLVYASVADQASTESAVSLTFAHKLSQLQITIQNNAAIDLSDAVVSVTGTNIDASFNTQTGAVTAAETANVKDIKAATINAATTVYAVVVPQTIAANTQLVKITTSSKVYVAKLATEATLAGGKAYKFTVNLGENTEVSITLGSTSIVAWGDPEDLGSTTMEEETTPPLYATFGAINNGNTGNATWNSETNLYTWTGSTGNLMDCFTFNDGKLTNYSKLTFTLSGLATDSSQGVRVGYYVGDSWTEIGNWYGNGTKTVTLSEKISVDFSTVTRICFGGKSNASTDSPVSCTLTNMYLE